MVQLRGYLFGYERNKGMEQSHESIEHVTQHGRGLVGRSLFSPPNGILASSMNQSQNSCHVKWYRPGQHR